MFTIPESKEKRQGIELKPTRFYSLIRSATNSDCDSIIQLIDSVLGEWNDKVCLEDAEKDLLDVQKYYWDAGGAFVVLQWENEIIGTHGILPVDSAKGVCTFKRLYLDPRFRGTKAGHDLMQWNIDWVTQRGFKKIEFWSDTRFARAHQFFQKFGFQKSGQPKEMNDSHQPYWEYYFSRNLHNLEQT